MDEAKRMMFSANAELIQCSTDMIDIVGKASLPFVYLCIARKGRRTDQIRLHICICYGDVFLIDSPALFEFCYKIKWMEAEDWYEWETLLVHIEVYVTWKSKHARNIFTSKLPSSGVLLYVNGVCTEDWPSKCCLLKNRSTILASSSNLKEPWLHQHVHLFCLVLVTNEQAKIFNVAVCKWFTTSATFKVFHSEAVMKLLKFRSHLCSAPFTPVFNLH